MSDPPKTPAELDAIARIVLNYKPKPKTKAAKKRKRQKAKAGQQKSSLI
jgi:hypothetical protein